MLHERRDGCSQKLDVMLAHTRKKHAPIREEKNEMASPGKYHGIFDSEIQKSAK